MHGFVSSRCLWLVALIVVASRLASAASINDFAVFSLTEGTTTLLRGRLYVPPEASQPGPRPFLLFLHGAGESGTNNTAQVNVNIDNLLAEAKRRGAFLYAPQTNNGWGNATTNQRVMTMIDRALAEHNVDDGRLYVTGLSMGGGGTWNMLHSYGDRFAAGVPICAVAPASGVMPANLLDDSIWAFHARNDGTVGVTTSRNVVNGLLAAAGEGPPTYLTTRDFVDSHFTSLSHDLQYTEYYTGGHGIWGRVYNTPVMYDWLFAHAVPEPSAIVTMAGLALAFIAQKRRNDSRRRWCAGKRRCSRRFTTCAALLIVCCGAACSRVATAQAPRDGDSLRTGRNFIETKAYSVEEDRAVLKLFDGLRVADISDGTDQAGLADAGLVSAKIGPLWKDTQHFTHRVIGVAVTVRYVPANDPRPAAASAEEFDKWVGETYSRVTPEPFTPLLREGSVLVIEEAEETDVGSIGSNNIMGWKLGGCVGVVTSGTARDTDEIAAQKIPLYFRHVGRGIRPGRNEVESVNRPVVVGGVQVVPGDVVAADGDGVIVVPRQYAEQVARYARATLETDKAARRGLYERLGLPEDDSVR